MSTTVNLLIDKLRTVEARYEELNEPAWPTRKWCRIASVPEDRENP